MIEIAIYSLLSGASSVTDLVGTRIYPLVREQSESLPAITYQIISAPRAYDLSGPNGLVESRIQINCFAATQITAAQLSAAVRSVLNGFSGSSAGIKIENILLDDESDLPVLEPENEAMNVYAKTMDFFVCYKE